MSQFSIGFDFFTEILTHCQFRLNATAKLVFYGDAECIFKYLCKRTEPTFKRETKQNKNHFESKQLNI